MSGLIEKSAVFFLVGFFLLELFPDVAIWWLIITSWSLLLILLRLGRLGLAARYWPLILVAALLGLTARAASTSPQMPIEGTLSGPFSAQVKQSFRYEETRQTALRLRDLQHLPQETAFGQEAGLFLPGAAPPHERGQNLILDGLMETGPDAAWRFRGTIAEESGFSALAHQAAEIRKVLGARMTRQVGSDLEPWLSALILGQDLDSAADRDRLRAAGAGHFFAVSGLHMGLVAAMLWTVLRSLRLERRRAQLWALPILCFYAIITGGRPPVMRAFALITMLVLADAAGRPIRPFRLLTLLFALALAVNPRLIHDISFAFSFAAVAGIVGMTGKTKIEKSALAKFLERKRRRPWRRGLLTTLGISEAAFLATAPLQAFYFGQIAPVAILSSCLLLPLVTLMLAFGLLGLVGPIPEPVTSIIASALIFGLDGLASLPGAVLDLGKVPKMALVSAWSGLVLAALWRRQGAAAWRYRSVAWLGFAALLVFASTERPEFVVTLGDTGQVVEVDWASGSGQMDLQPFDGELALYLTSQGKDSWELAQQSESTKAIRLERPDRALIFVGPEPLKVMNLPWGAVQTLVFMVPPTATESLLLMERFHAQDYFSLGELDADSLRLLTAEGYLPSPDLDLRIQRQRPKP